MNQKRCSGKGEEGKVWTGGGAGVVAAATDGGDGGNGGDGDGHGGGGRGRSICVCWKRGEMILYHLFVANYRKYFCMVTFITDRVCRKKKRHDVLKIGRHSDKMRHFAYLRPSNETKLASVVPTTVSSREMR